MHALLVGGEIDGAVDDRGHDRLGVAAPDAHRLLDAAARLRGTGRGRSRATRPGGPRRDSEARSLGKRIRTQPRPRIELALPVERGRRAAPGASSARRARTNGEARATATSTIASARNVARSPIHSMSGPTTRKPSGPDAYASDVRTPIARPSRCGGARSWRTRFAIGLIGPYARPVAAPSTTSSQNGGRNAMPMTGSAVPTSPTMTALRRRTRCPTAAVRERADDAADAHRHEDDAEALRRVLSLEVDGEDHPLDRDPRADEHREEDRERTEHPVVPDEEQTLDTVSPHRAALAVGRPVGSGDGRGTSRPMSREADRRRPERRLGPDPCDEQAAERGADEERDAQHRLVHAVHALAPEPGGVGRRREHRLAGGHAGRVEDGAERGEREEQPEREEVELRRDRNRGDAQAAQDVGRDRRSPAAEAVDDRPGDERGEHERQRGDRRDEADVGRAAR